jgi:myo-inositol 2-dehydrogenase/D-chiro-inositol 1-dehydrogenase
MNRREFLGAAGAAGLMIVKPQAVRGSQANSAIRIGLLGCGGRGTSVATGFAKNTAARIAALGDLFPDQLEKAKARFDKIAPIDPSQVFQGPKAFEQIAASKEIDAVLITTPPYFHPQHLEAAVAAGKHVYVEKPVAVDVPGSRRVLAAGRKAEGKLSLDVGLQLRMAPPFIEAIRRIQAGALGEIAFGQAWYFCPFLALPDFPNASPAERRLRHWLHDRVLSGDILVEQDIHALDICSWTLNALPVKCVGTGGRKGRSEEGTNYSHYSLTYYYPNDVHVNFSSTQFGNKVGFDVSERFFGTRGRSETPYAGPVMIEGEEKWVWGSGSQGQQNGPFSLTGDFNNSNIDTADAEKQKAFIESIVSGKFHNQAAAGVDALLTCIMGRTAAYTGRPVTWEETVKSNEVWESGINIERL